MPRNRVGGLELGRDHEVDVDQPLLPGLEVFRVRSPHDRLRLRDALRQRPGDEVDLVPRRTGDHEVGKLDVGLLEHASGRAVALHRADVEVVRERLQPRGVEIDDGDLVIAVQRFDDGRAHLPRADKDDLHGDGSLVPTQVSVSAEPGCYVESHSGSSSMPTASAIRFT